MNIYNKLFILEYTRDPCIYYHSNSFSIHWILNLSENKYWYEHRNFDIVAYINHDYICWSQYNKVHRIIGPASIIQSNNFKSYYIRNKLISRHKQK